MAENTTSPGTSPGTSGTPPGNVYHKEQRSPRVQRTKKPRLESGIHIQAPRKQERDNPYRQAVMMSFRRFFFAAAIMILLFYVALKGLRVMDERYGMQFTPKPDDKVASEEDVLPPRTSPATAPSAAVSAASDTTRPAAELDNDAIRKAAFLARRGKNLESEGSLDEAIARYRESLDTWPYQPQVWTQLGRIYLRQGDYTKAQSALERAALDDPSAPQLLNDLGVAYLQRGNFDVAAQKFAAYAEYDPTYAPAYFNASLCQIGKRNYQKAREAIAKFLELKPDDAKGLRQAAFIDASTTNLVGAMEGIEKALKIAPDWALLYLDAAATSALLGRTNETFSYLAQAEAKTAPGVVYLLYTKPAFESMRTSAAGIAYEKDLLARTQASAAAASNAVDAARAAAAEPISSVTESP